MVPLGILIGLGQVQHKARFGKSLEKTDYKACMLTDFNVGEKTVSGLINGL